MKLNCISCGHSLSLDDAYDDFGGFVKCYVCGGLLEIRTAEGKIQSVKFAVTQPSAGQPQALGI